MPAPYHPEVGIPPRGHWLSWPMIWAVRAVPALLAFEALSLLRHHLPLTFVVLTMVRLALGVLTVLAIRRQRRDRLALAYVVVVLLTSLANPVLGAEVLVVAAFCLVATGVNLLRQRNNHVDDDQDLSQELGPAPSE